MHSQLSKVIDSFEHAQGRLERLAESVRDDRWSVRSDPSRWSVAECVAHINMTDAAYVPRLRKGIEEARKLPRAGARSYRADFLGRMFAAMTGPLPKIGNVRLGRVKTTAAFIPSGNFPKPQLVADFKRNQVELVRMVHESDGLAIDEVKITSPFGEKIHYNIFSTFLILPRHTERHLQQAELVWS